MVWLKLDASLPMNGVWDDILVFRLWIWILCKAKVARPNGTIRFSYPVVAEKVAWRDGLKVRTPTRKSLRRALRSLVKDGRVKVDEWVQGWEQARDKGGAQGYITVNVCNWGCYQHATKPKGTGSVTGKGTGLDGSRVHLGEIEVPTEPKREDPMDLLRGVTPKSPKRRQSPREKAARVLKATIGATSLPACRSQLKSLETAGWSVEQMLSSIKEHGAPGLAPWEWTQKATGSGKPTTNPEDIFRMAEKYEQEGQ